MNCELRDLTHKIKTVVTGPRCYFVVTDSVINFSGRFIQGFLSLFQLLIIVINSVNESFIMH